MNSTPEISIQYLGQVGFKFQCCGQTVVVDPYLSYSVDRLPGFPPAYWVRNYPPPLRMEELCDIDLVLCTHDHLDHADAETLLAIARHSPQARFAGPRLTVQAVQAAGIRQGRLTVLNEGAGLELGDLTVRPVAEAHEAYEQDAEGFHRYLGYILDWAGLVIFHAGDTVVTPQLVDALASQPIDVAFLPINGGDEDRRRHGVVGNMNGEAALRLARRLAVDLLVPTHYDLYPRNGSTAAAFTAAWEKLPFAGRPAFKVFLPGECAVYRRPSRKAILAVVIGAGRTGRGFLARLLAESGYRLAFIDRSAELVRLLNEDRAFTVHFFGGGQPPQVIEDFQAALAESDEAAALVADAAIVFSAVGESNVGALAPLLAAALKLRRERRSPRLPILVCENGAAPAAPLRRALAEYAHEGAIAEAAIFCSTVERSGSRLDLESESYDELPYDAAAFSGLPGCHTMKPVADFASLLQRKIYTYNCFSACIAYLGARQGYVWYSDAARDPEIVAVIGRIAPALNAAVALKYQVAFDEQVRFAEAALRKFQDAAIRDDIARNARQVIRKLASDDRLVAPARLIRENGGSTCALALVIAAALHYRGPDESDLAQRLEQEGVGAVIAQISALPPDDPLVRQVADYFQALKSGRPLLEILDSR